MGLRLLGLPALQHRLQCRPLRVVRALVDDDLYLALALVDRAGPRAGERGGETVQADLAEAPLRDPEDLETPAMTVGRLVLELPGAAIAQLQFPKAGF